MSKDYDDIIYNLGKMAHTLGQWAMMHYKDKDPEYLQACVDLMKQGSRMIAESGRREVEDLSMTNPYGFGKELNK